MSAVPMFGAFAQGQAVNSNVTTYSALLAGRQDSVSTTESQRQYTARVAGVWAKGTITVSANTIATSATTVTSRLNAGAGNQSLSIAAGATGVTKDTSNTDSVSAGDEVNWRIETPNTSGALTFTHQAMSYAASSNSAVMVHMRPVGTTANGITNYQPLCGGDISATEANNQCSMRASATMQDLMVNVFQARAVAETFGSRLNAANGNLTLTTTSSTTGIYEDTSNSDNIVSGDEVNLFCSYGASGAVIGFFSGVTLLSTSREVPIIGQGTAAIAASATQYKPLAQALASASTFTTEADVQIKAPETGVGSDLSVYISANTVSATSNLRFRTGGGNGNQNVAITASTTGLFEDASNSDSVTEGDLIDYSVATGASGTSLFPRVVHMLWTAPAPADRLSRLALLGVG